MDHLSDIQNERGGPMHQAMTLRIRERAYHIWAAQGGDADKNWLQAETEILRSLRPQAAPASALKQKGRGARNRKSAAAAKVS
jgi:Protein of unknown function (DUF2934)